MGTNTKRRIQRERREATRQRILEAALKTLVERGYAGTSTWAICATGGFSKGTLLYHFKQRHQIFEALMAELTTQSLNSLETSMEAADPRDRSRLSCSPFAFPATIIAGSRRLLACAPALSDTAHKTIRNIAILPPPATPLSTNACS